MFALKACDPLIENICGRVLTQCTLLSFGTAFLLTSGASADPVTFGFSGVTTTSTSFTPSLPVGTSFSVSITFDDDAPDLITEADFYHPFPENVGSYRELNMTGALTLGGEVVDVSQHKFQGVYVENDTPPLGEDSFQLFIGLTSSDELCEVNHNPALCFGDSACEAGLLASQKSCKDENNHSDVVLVDGAELFSVRFELMDSTGAVFTDEAPIVPDLSAVDMAEVQFSFVSFRPSGGTFLEGVLTANIVDTDADGIPDGDDNCPRVANTNQADVNVDGFGDACVSLDADVSDQAELGPGTRVGVNSHVRKGVVTGEDNDIGENVVFGNNVETGDSLVVGNGAVLGRKVNIGDSTVIGANVIIGDHCAIGAGVIIGDNSRISKNCNIGDNASIGANVRIRRDVTVLSSAVIPDGETIDKNSTVGPQIPMLLSGKVYQLSSMPRL